MGLKRGGFRHTVRSGDGEGGSHEKLKLPLSHHPAHGVLAMFGAVLGWSAGVPQFEVMHNQRGGKKADKGRNDMSWHE